MEIKRMPLPDKRLQAAADMVPVGTVADIGCDHGRLICHLVHKGIATKGYACDISAPSLAKAQSLAKRFGLDVACIKTDGLKDVPPCDTVIIAGMGGQQMCDILALCDWIKQPGRTLVLQPMSRAGQLRIFLASNGFETTRETAVRHRGRVYAVMACTYTGTARRLPALESMVGKIPASDSDCKLEYYEKQLNMLYDLKQGLLAIDKSADHIENLIVELKRLVREEMKT